MSMCPDPRRAAIAAVLGCLYPLGGVAGGQPSLPPDFDVHEGRGVVWEAALGSYAYAGPVLADGRIFVGTNNANPRDPQLTDDRGVLMVFRARDGEFLWQATHAKLAPDLDFPLQGLCSTPAVVDDRVYYVSNRGELVCADVQGFHDGVNDGPFRDEPRDLQGDADLVWRLDMPAELGVVPHFMSASTPLVEGDLVFVNTSNGIGESGGVPAPTAPSFLAVRRDTGAVVWSSAAASPRLLDGQWGSPRWLDVEGTGVVLFGAGDGHLYGLEPSSGRALWTLDGNAVPGAAAGHERWRNVFVASPVVVGSRIYVALGRDPEEGSADGGLWAWERGTEPDAPVLAWFYGGDDFGRAIADVAVADGVVYAADLDGFLVALDAETGTLRWKYDALAPIWATPVVTPEGVWVADIDGDVALLGRGAEREVRTEIETGAPIYRAPVAAEGRLYLMTTERLYALGSPP